MKQTGVNLHLSVKKIRKYGQGNVAIDNASYEGIDKRPDSKAQISWHVAICAGERRALNKQNAADALIVQAEKLNAAVRAKVENPFGVIKSQFGFAPVRYRGLKKNTQQLVTLFALANL